MTSHGDGNRENQVTRAVGRYEGHTVLLSVRADPSLDADAPEEFAVTLSVRVRGGSNVDVARIDTSHDGVHHDRLCLPEDHPLRRDHGVEVVDYRDAQRTILANWRAHVATHEENHGLPKPGAEDRG